MQTYKMKEIYKHTKEEPIIRFWEETNKRITQKQFIHSMVSQTAEKIEYNSMGATIMAIMINEINNRDTVKRS